MCDCKQECRYKLGCCEASQCTRNNENFFLDGLQVVMGDRLYCLLHGWGEVIGWDYASLTVRFYNYKAGAYDFGFLYDTTGSLWTHKQRSLYWDKPKFDPPKPPKKKVKKYKFVYYDERASAYKISEHYYESKEDFESKARKDLEALYCIKKSEKEVEE